MRRAVSLNQWTHPCDPQEYDLRDRPGRRQDPQLRVPKGPGDWPKWSAELGRDPCSAEREHVPVAGACTTPGPLTTRRNVRALVEAGRATCSAEVRVVRAVLRTTNISLEILWREPHVFARSAARTRTRAGRRTPCWDSHAAPHGAAPHRSPGLAPRPSVSEGKCVSEGCHAFFARCPFFVSRGGAFASNTVTMWSVAGYFMENFKKCSGRIHVSSSINCRCS